MKFYISKWNSLLFLYFLWTLIFLYLWGIDAIEQRIDFEFYADTETYMEYAKKGYSISYLVSNFPNLIGPLTILSILDSNYYLVFFLNILILYYFVKTVRRFYEINNLSFYALIFISPMLFISIIGINKEIFTILVITLLLQYRNKKKFYYLVFAFLTSFLVRWQMAIFVLTTWFFFIGYNGQRKYFKLFLILLGCSVVYFFNKDRFNEVNMIAIKGVETNAGNGFYTTMIGVQNSNPIGYFLVFIPKFVFLYCSKLIKYQNLFDPNDFHNNTIVVIQSMLHFITLALIFLKEKFKLNYYLSVSMLMYAIIFTLTPVYSPRYLFPIYIYSAIVLALKTNDK